MQFKLRSQEKKKGEKAIEELEMMKAETLKDINCWFANCWCDMTAPKP